jgi:hypothetical protein
MALTGEQARIQALFGKLRTENETTAPRFKEVWPSVASIAPQRSFARNLGVATSALVLVFSSLLCWWLSGDRQQLVVSASTAAGLAATRQPAEPYRNQVTDPSRIKRQAHKPLPRTKTKLAPKSSIKMAGLSSWRSPTAKLIESSEASVLKSLPQLTEAASALQSFLAVEETKELNK